LSCNAINDAETNSGLVSVHPNPSRDGKFRVTIPFGTRLGNITVEVYNALGEKIPCLLIKPVNLLPGLETTIDVAFLLGTGCGIYFLRGTDGTNHFSKKIIIQ
jgi:hypothetical protein